MRELDMTMIESQDTARKHQDQDQDHEREREREREKV